MEFPENGRLPLLWDFIFTKSVYLFANPLLGRTLSWRGWLFLIWLGPSWLNADWTWTCLEFRGEEACRCFHPLEDQSRAPRFSQDHKRSLSSDVEKLQAWLGFILERRVRGQLGWKQGVLLPWLAGEKHPRRCVCPFLTLGRVLDGEWAEWDGESPGWGERVLVGGGLICWCSSVISGPTGHQPWNRLLAFLEWGRLLALPCWVKCVYCLKISLHPAAPERPVVEHKLYFPRETGV